MPFLILQLIVADNGTAPPCLLREGDVSFANANKTSCVIL